MLPDKTVDAQLLRLRVRLGRHALAKGRELAIGVVVQTLQRCRVAHVAGGLHQSPIERAQPLDQRRAGVTAHVLRSAPRRVHLAHDVIQDGIQPPILPGPQRREPRDEALEVRRKRALFARRLFV